MRRLALSLGYLASCLEPTEVKLELTTDILDLQHVIIRVDAREVARIDHPPDASGKFGRLVFVPSKSMRDRFTVVVEGSTAAQSVRASRSIAYVSHTSLELPIVLEKSCLDHVCPMGQTCQAGNCENDTVDCGANRTCVPEAGPDGTSTVDSGVDSGVDAGPDPCKGASTLSLGAQKYHWSFEESGGDAIDSIGKVSVPLGSGYSRTSLAPCGQALTIGGMTSSSPQPMKISMPGPLALAFQTRIPKGTTLPVNLAQGIGSTPYWKIIADRTPLVLVVQFGFTIAAPDVPSTIPLAFDVTYHVEIFSNSTSVVFSVDGKTETVKTGGFSLPLGLPLSVGPGGDTLIDELSIYDGVPPN